MGRGGFPPSETGSFSAHHTAQWVGFLVQVAGLRCQVSGRLGSGFHRSASRSCEFSWTGETPVAENYSPARLSVELSLQLEHLN